MVARVRVELAPQDAPDDAETRQVERRRLGRSWSRSRRLPWIGLVFGIVAAGLALPAPPAAAAATPGTLTAFAGGPGVGIGTNLGQSPVGVAAVGDLVIEIDGPGIAAELPPLGMWYPTVVRVIDPGSGLEMPLAGTEYAGGYSPDGVPAVGSPLGGAGTVVGDPFGNLYLSESGANRIRMISPSGVITTIVGTGAGAGGFSGDGGPAKTAQLRDPAGMAFAPDGSFVFADRGNNRIRRVDSNGVISTIAGTGAYGSAGDGGPAAQAELNGPGAIGFDAAGNLYIAEIYGDRIRKVSPAGTIGTFVQTATPLGLAVTPAGTVLFPSGAGIRSITATGQTAMIAGSQQESGYSGDGGPATGARLRNPRSVAVDARGNVYVADTGNRRVRRIDPAGVITTIAGNGRVNFGGDGAPAPYSQLQRVYGIRSGPFGTYILDGENGIRHVDPAGTIRTTETAFTPIMTTDRAGNVYIGRPGEVSRRSPDGTVTVLARNGDPGIGTDLDPRALAVDGSGNLYIADYDAQYLFTTIRRVSADGVITPWAGVAPLHDTHPSYPEPARHSPIRLVNDMAVGADGVLYAATSHGLLRFSCGVVSRPATNGILYMEEGSWGPRGMAVDRAGNLYFAADSKVYRLRPDGQWTVVAGGGRARIQEGVAATSVDLRPWVGAVSLDDAGDLLFATTTRVLKVAGVSAGAAVPGPACTEPAPGTTASPASYQPVPPARILDTRTGTGTGGVMKAVGPASTITLDVTGVGGVPEAGVSAVALNVTVTEPSGGGYLTVFPSGTPRPTTSTINFLPGQTVANMAVAKVGNDGKVDIYNATGTSHVVVDVVGWYGDQGSRFNSLVPARILDTRTGTGGFTAVGPGSTIDVPFTGVGGVPASGVSAVVLNLTVTQPTAGGFLTVFPSGTARLTTSSINFLPGQTVANMAVAKVGSDGKVSIYNAAGATHVVVDVVGWYGDQGSPFYSLAPARILDTRNGTGGFPVGPVPAGATINAIATTIGGLPDTGVSAVVLNVTVTEPAVGGYLTLYPYPQPRPPTSSINFATGQTVANLVVSKVLADGKVVIYNGGGAAHVVIDVVGWYGTA
jgi:sugar lactone lactonase YvrE